MKDEAKEKKGRVKTINLDNLGVVFVLPHILRISLLSSVEDLVGFLIIISLNL